MTALLEVTALLEYFNLLQFSFQSFNVFLLRAVTSVASMVATALLKIDDNFLTSFIII